MLNSDYTLNEHFISNFVKAKLIFFKVSARKNSILIIVYEKKTIV